MKLTADDTGCYIDGHWGQYGIARLVDIARGYGYGDDNLPGTAEVIAIASKKLEAMTYPSRDITLTDDEEERLSDASDEVEDWLNVHVAPEGCSFGWHDGEFFLASAWWWEES